MPIFGVVLVAVAVFARHSNPELGWPLALAFGVIVLAAGVFSCVFPGTIVFWISDDEVGWGQGRAARRLSLESVAEVDYVSDNHTFTFRLNDHSKRRGGRGLYEGEVLAVIRVLHAMKRFPVSYEGYPVDGSMGLSCTRYKSARKSALANARSDRIADVPPGARPRTVQW